MTRRTEIFPGSVEDRIREACPAGKGATFEEILAAALIRRGDLRDYLDRLRAQGYIRIYGETKARKYFWRATNRRRAA